MGYNEIHIMNKTYNVKLTTQFIKNHTKKKIWQLQLSYWELEYLN